MSLSIEQSTACAEILEKKTADQESFSAYDITLALRAEGHWVEHGDVKNYVHNYMRHEMQYGLEYAKNIENVTPTLQAYVYSPETVDAADGDDTDVIKTDGRGRLCISASLVRKIGSKAGDVVSCVDDSGIMRITGKVLSPGNSFASYLVDKDDNIRISPSTLQTALGDVDQYKVYHDDVNDCIAIEIAV